MTNSNQMFSLMVAQQHLPMRDAVELSMLGTQNQGVSLVLTQKLAKDIAKLRAETSSQAIALSGAKAKIAVLEAEAEAVAQDSKDETTDPDTPTNSDPDRSSVSEPETGTNTGTSTGTGTETIVPIERTETERLRRDLEVAEAARAALHTELTEEKRLHRNTEERLETRTNRVDILKNEVKTLEAKVVEPLNRADFKTEFEFEDAARTQALQVMTRVMTPASLDAINEDEHLAELQALPTEVKAKFSAKLDELHSKFKASVKADMPEHYKTLFPHASDD